MKCFLPTAYNRAYLASCLRYYAQIRLRRTSDTLETLYAIVSKGLNIGQMLRKEKVIEMKNNILAIWVCTMILLIVSSSGCLSTTYNVKYEVTGSASKVFITYQNENGGTSQEEASVPWSYSFTAESGDFVYVSAQNQGDNGSVTVTIYKDGEVFKTSTSSGGYVIATADGRL